MIKITEFKLEHLIGFIQTQSDMDLEPIMCANMENNSRDILSLLGKEGLICIAGMNYLRKGVGELWLIPGTLVEKNKLEFYKTVKSLIYGYVFKELGMHRLEMAIKADWEKGLKWAKSLGFSKEGYMREWNDKREDHILFAKVVKSWQ